MKTVASSLRRLALPIVLLGALGAGLPLHAGDHDRARRALERGEVLPLRSVLDAVEHQVPGHVLEIEFEHDDGRFIYEMRVLQPDGRIAKLKVDAVDGRVLRIKRKPRHD